jgi:cell division transport system permease protein
MKFFFSIREGLKGMAKAKMATVLSISSITLTAILVGFILVINLNMQSLLKIIRDKIEIELFIVESTQEEKINNLKEQISEIEGVNSITYISKEEAAKRFKDEFGYDIYEVLDYNPLPTSFVISMAEKYRTVDRVILIKNKLEALPFVDEVSYNRPLLQKLDRYINLVLIGIISAAVLITIIATTLIYNTIRLSIFARKDIIYIMRLVGATEGFIRRPFIIEGMIQGLIGCMVASVITYYLVRVINVFVFSGFSFDYYVFIGLILFGIIVGMLSAYLSVGKYLKNL